MGSFLNINLDRKIPRTFLFKHILFSSFWISGLLVVIFRIDVFLIDKYFPSVDWLKGSVPFLFFALLVLTCFFLKWYYILAFVFYPFLMIFWFLPKTVLSVGKVYLFGTYIAALFSRLAKLKVTILKTFLFVLCVILLLTIGSIWIRWVAIAVMSYFFLSYVYKFLKGSFRQPAIFDAEFESKIKAFIENKNPENSFVVKSFILQKEDDKLQIEERRETQIRRTVLANYALELLTNKLGGYRGRQAYIVSWIFGALIFMLFSICFFWFLNFQLYKIDAENFVYQGTFPPFDFLYYTLKTITFGDIELVKPQTTLARISEISSFATIGIFALVIVVSVFLSMKQDKVNENVRLTTDMFRSENLTLTTFMKENFGMEIKTAMGELKNIDTSLKNLKNFIDKIF